MQYFVKPGEDEKYFEEWKAIRFQWWVDQGLKPEHLRFLPHEELAFYAKAAEDIEYEFPWGFDEIEGIHNRQDYDLGSHTKNQNEFDIKAKVKPNTDSTTKLNYADAVTKENFIPFVVETAAGLDRAMIAIINEAYDEETLPDGSVRNVLHFKKHLAPIKVAVIPLKKNHDGIMSKCHEIKNQLLKLGIGRVSLENTGNIGKAYRRHDEIGTPLCITVDFETLENQPESVTIRDRDTMEQIRVNTADLDSYIKNYFL
jgi:glycyl-tRNA synthetase